MRVGPRIVEAGLWLVAGACAFWSLLWVLGANGFGTLRYDTVPRWLDPVSLYGTNGMWVAHPVPSVVLSSADQERIGEVYAALSDPTVPGAFPAHYASLVPDSRVFLQQITTGQRLTYLLLHVLSYLALAFVAVTLARLVTSARAGSPFTHVNAGRLRRIGLVLLVGAPVASFLEWLVLRWMVESSSLSSRVDLYGYRLSSLPLWTMLVGAAVLVLGDVWRRGVRMAEDVRGLV